MSSLSHNMEHRTMIKSWSYSRIREFNRCPYALYLSAIKGVKPESSPVLERGTRIHKTIETYIKKGSHDQINELSPKHVQLFDLLHSKIPDVHLEEEWGFDIHWTPAPWKSAWVRIKVDAIYIEGTTAFIYDWKTGKSLDKQFETARQAQLYAVGTLHRFHNVRQFYVFFVYVDEDKEISYSYTDDMVRRFQKTWENKGNALTQASTFPPRPSKNNCKYCSVRNQCEWNQAE